jgi:hypothetical protein
MGARVEELYNQECYDIAETWFRRVVRAKKFVNWYKPHQTLWACLQVVKCIRFQCRYREAQQLQQGLHSTIERTLGANHEISIKLKNLNADLLGNLGFTAEEEVLRRQVLQIHLTTLGMRHPSTIRALEELGSALDTLERHSEAQLLLEASLYFRFEEVKSLGDSSILKSCMLWDVATLAGALNNNRRYDESNNVLDFAHNLLGDRTRERGWHCFKYHYERARTYRLQKRFENSEKILRGLLKYHLNYMPPGMTIRSMNQLTEILVETGRHREAAFWNKKEYLLYVKKYGLIHRYTMTCCQDVGFCYANQSRYNEGKLFFEGVIEMLDLSSEESDSRTLCIQKIKTWMDRLEEMRAGEISESVDSEREPIDNDDDVDYEDMGDIPDPLDY